MADAMGFIKIKIKIKNTPEFTHPSDGCLPPDSESAWKATPLVQECCHCSKHFWNSSLGISSEPVIKCPVENDECFHALELTCFWKQPKVTHSNFSRMKHVDQME